MERKIGEIFNFHGVVLQVYEAKDRCKGCFFENYPLSLCLHQPCIRRKDKKNIIFKKKMEKNEKNVLERNLEQKAFENATKAIKGGKESGSLTYVELVENLVENYKGKTIQAPLEVIVTSALFLNARELTGIIETLKHTLYVKMAEELVEKADKGEATVKDAMAALMLAAIIKEKKK